MADTQQQLLDTLKALPDRIAELGAGQERLAAGQDRLIDRLASLERRLLDPWDGLSTSSDSALVCMRNGEGDYEHVVEAAKQANVD